MIEVSSICVASPASIRGRCLGSTMSTVTSEHTDDGVTSAVCDTSGNVTSDVATGLSGNFISKAMHTPCDYVLH